MVKNVRINGATYSSITLTWDQLHCVDHNGELTGYSIEYDTTASDSEIFTSTTSITFTVTGLNPQTIYTFRVAGVNSNGTGTQSMPVNGSTLPSGKPSIQIMTGTTDICSHRGTSET